MVGLRPKSALALVLALILAPSFTAASTARAADGPELTLDKVELLGTAADEYGTDIAVGLDGSYFVLIRIDDPHTGKADVAVLAFTSWGHEQWRFEFDAPADDYPGAIAVTDRAVFVVGSTWSRTFLGQQNAGGIDIFVAKLSLRGNLQWARLLGDRRGDFGYGISPAARNAVYVVGGSIGWHGGGGAQDALVAKYSPVGHPVWTQTYGSADYDAATAVAKGSTGNAVVVGTSEIKGGCEIVLTEYRPNGEAVRDRRVAGRQCNANGVTVSNSGQTYVAGTITGGPSGGVSNSGADAVLIAYGYEDRPRWVKRIGGSGEDAGVAVATGDDGLIYLVGTTASASVAGRRGHGGKDMFIASFGVYGGRRWVSRFGGPGDDYADGVAVPRYLLQPAPNVIFVAGSSGSPTVSGSVNHGKSDVLIARLSE